MGTLDDAIREHLELKRRSGAPDEEVSRLEHEAFGPIRRDAPPAEPAAGTEAETDAGAAEPAATDEPAFLPPEEEEEASAPPTSEPPPPRVREPEPEAPEDALPAVPPVVPPTDPFTAGPPVVPPPPTQPATRSWLDEEEDAASLRRPPAQSTSEFTAAEAAEAQGRPASDYVAPDEEGDDLLEETPDFLQETPEHDRLWFEQRPPRDFDFDE